MSERVETVVIGAGQAGLSAGYYLARRGRPFVILDAGDRIGGSWWDRWDSMRLFTPTTHCGLPGMRFPGRYSFPPATAMADYLQQYAARFELPVRAGVRVDGVFREGDGFRVTAGPLAYLAENVVLATGVHRRPRTPDFAGSLAPHIVQLHSAAYRNADALAPGAVLVVGAGNSGADIALELAATRRTLLAGRHPGHIPVRIESRRARMLFPFLWWTWTHVLTERTPMGRKVQAQRIEGHGDQLIRVKPADLDAAGVERIGRVTGVVDGRPSTDDRVLDVGNVIWCTGFLPDFDWVELPGLDSSGRLANDRGRVVGQPGLYVLGQEFQHMFNSHTVGGVGRDAAFVVADLARRMTVRGRAAAEVRDTVGR